MVRPAQVDQVDQVVALEHPVQVGQMVHQALVVPVEVVVQAVQVAQAD